MQKEDVHSLQLDGCEQQEDGSEQDGHSNTPVPGKIASDAAGLTTGHISEDDEGDEEDEFNISALSDQNKSDQNNSLECLLGLYVG